MTKEDMTESLTRREERKADSEERAGRRRKEGRRGGLGEMTGREIIRFHGKDVGGEKKNGSYGEMKRNKSNRTTMRPLGIYLIGISMYILNMIHFLMILVNFGVFSLMVIYRHTDQRTYGHTDTRRDRPSYRDARTHLKTTSWPEKNAFS